MAKPVRNSPLLTRLSDADWLAAAARLSGRGRPLSRPNPSVGCILVKDGKVVGRGWTQAGGRPHAEAMALEAAGSAAHGATAYVTLEPCAHDSRRGPACADLLTEAGVSSVIAGVEDPDPRTAGEGIRRLSSAGIKARILASNECEASLAGYLTRQRLGRPHITVKLAMSLDGYIALANGESKWITGNDARSHVHARRAQSDAILVGGATWREDKPQLNVRLPGLKNRSPQRLVLTRGIAPSGVKFINTPQQVKQLEDVLYLYVEGGAGAAAAFLSEGLVDRIDIYRAPILIGGGRPALNDIGLEALADAHGKWRMTERRQLGSDSFEAYEHVT